MKAFALAVMSQVFITLSVFPQSLDHFQSLQVELIPERSEYAPTGSEFVESIRYLQGRNESRLSLTKFLLETFLTSRKYWYQ